MFNEWLREWWEGYNHEKVTAEVATVTPSLTSDPLEIISKYLSKEATDVCEDNMLSKTISSAQKEHQCHATDVEKTEICFNFNDETKDFDGSQHNETFAECTKLFSHGVDDRDADGITGHVTETELLEEGKKSSQQDHLLIISQEDLEAVIRRVSRDSSLDSKSKSYLIQNLLMRLVRSVHSILINGRRDSFPLKEKNNHCITRYTKFSHGLKFYSIYNKPLCVLSADEI